ncbi:50S ribosomal protein L27 [Candidatus Woesebacteria bacterium]|jgi:large subunit ribosomal protein L27|nr:50S ribosomal protein L27 [Candidatus Woesebacteria bacterium]
MAHTKSQKAAKGNRDSIAKRLGVKLYGGQAAKPGNIIIRQRGMTFRAGPGAYLSKDFTIHSSIDGTVTFFVRLGKKFVSVIAPKTS